MKISPHYKFLVLLLLLIIAFYVGAMSPVITKDRDQKLAQKIKDQLRGELRAEIKEELLAEIKKDQEQQKLVESKPAPVVQKIASHAISKPETLDEAIQRVSHEVIEQNQRDFILSDEELNQYTAGSEIESNLPVGSGYSKSPEMILAKNDVLPSSPSESSKVTKNEKPDDLNATAGEGQRAESVERTLQQRGSMLLGKGKWVIDSATSWAHFSSNKVNLQGVVIYDFFTIGVLGTQEVNRDILIENFSVKYGLLNNLQGEIKVPYRAQYERVTTNNASNTPSSETSRGALGLGDIDLSLSRQIGWEEGWKPDLIAAFGFKTRTGQSYGHNIFFGSGHYSFRSALIATKSSDPAVIFGSLSYTHNFERTGIEGLGDIKPGDAIGYSLGTAIALSYQTAINFSFDNSIVQKTVRNKETVLDSFLNTANFKTGLNWAIDERKSVNISVGFGLTKDSPDFTVDLGIPISF